MTKEAKILIGIAGAVVAGGIALSLLSPQSADPGQPIDSQSLLRDSSHMTGKKEAKVTIVEFGDYQCPACAQAHPAVKRIIEEYKDNSDVNFVFRNFPLDSIHPNARISAEAAEAAGAQGKFWEMHSKLYETQNEWSALQNPLDVFVGYAGSLGLNTDQFRESVSQRRFNEVIGTDLSDGEKAGVNSTPTFFINGEVNRKVFTYEELKSKIEERLKQ